MKAKIILAMVGIFVAGCVVGGFATASWKRDGRSKMSARDFSERHLQRMADRLDLTDEQVDRIRPVMTEFTDSIRAVRSRSFGEVREIFRDMNTHIEAELDSDQLVRHREFLEEQRARFDRAARRRGDGRRSLILDQVPEDGGDNQRFPDAAGD